MNIYKVVEAKIKNTLGEIQEVPQITKDRLPMFEICSWIYERSTKSKNTATRYANAMVSFLAFLDMRGVHYRTASRKDINAYIKYLLFGNDDNLFVVDPQCATSTIITNLAAISSFYKWLENEYFGVVPLELLEASKRQPNKHSFWYGQIWQLNFSKVIHRYLRRTKPNQEYIKWYSKEQQDALLSNFLTLRDKVIFAITLEGARIDEVLSMTLQSYDREKRTVTPTKSKTFIRPIVLPSDVCNELDRYIWTERADAESNCGHYSQWLFINIKSGRNQAHHLSYRSYWGTLKGCAERAGFDPKLIRTHNGRSTKTMELLEYQALYPEENLTDQQIRLLMGWANSASIKSYVNHQNMIIAKSAAEKVHRKRGE